MLRDLVRAWCILSFFMTTGALGAAAQDQTKNLVVTPTQGPLAGRTLYTASHALLIGVNEYPNLPRNKWLSYAVRDVEETRDVLVKSYGFPAENVRLLVNKEATLANIKEALASFADKRRVQADDRLLIYFSGHGQTVKLPTGGEMGFLLPSDAKVDLEDADNAGPYMNTCLGMDAVKLYLDSTPAKHTLVLADACYSGLMASAARSIRPSEQALAVLAAKRGSQVMTAGGKGEESLELANVAHGAFTAKVLEELKAHATIPGDIFNARDLFATVSTSVSNLTEGKQNPTMASLSGTEGTFFFVVAGSAANNSSLTAPAGHGAGASGTGGKAQAVDTSASLRVTTDPPGAKVFLDDAEIAATRTPATVQVELGRAKTREIEVAVELGGYKTSVQQATVERGKALPLTFKLAREAGAAPATPGEGQAPPGKASGTGDSGPSGAAGGISLIRRYHQGDRIRASTTISIAGLQPPVIITNTGTYTMEEVRPNGDGVQFYVQESEKVSVGGVEQPSTGDKPEPTRETRSRTGALVLYDDKPNPLLPPGAGYLMAVVTDAIVTDRPVKPGDTWQTSVPNRARPGTDFTVHGTYLGVESVDGVATWKIRQVAQIPVPTAARPSNTMAVDLTFWINISTGFSIKATGEIKNIPANMTLMDWNLSLQLAR